MITWKIKVASAALALCIVGVGAWYGVNAFVNPTKADATSNDEAAPNPVTTSQGVEALAGTDVKSLDPTEDEARKTIVQFHEQFNTWLGYGAYKTFKKDDENGNWKDARTYDEMKPETYRHLAEVLVKVQGAEIDLLRLADLAEIAQNENDVTAMRYMHRILHDLDYWAFGTGHGDYWGVSDTARLTFGDEAGKGSYSEINEYIQKHKK
ncbi:hypothetical protein FHS19_003300 [Paenibacillus rhizosphaerae]|uniref:Uncharacterized protein n=1 Tax=Paenibacillus rhizosphaerae TaxID=297318 RepID=A0A839TPA6_9BACL|nr:hypothetical protein [Paenibacillus rhizosphaerae]MBB3128646.1 hypothetical protein [Paenibacillus rhizosphaerae]